MAFNLKKLLEEAQSGAYLKGNAPPAQLPTVGSANFRAGITPTLQPSIVRGEGANLNAGIPATPITNPASSFIQRNFTPKSMGNVLKSVVKPFWETGDVVKSGIQAGVGSLTNNPVATQNALQNRDQSYQESLVPIASRSYNRLSETPLGYVINPVNKIADQQIEKQLQDMVTKADSLPDNPETLQVKTETNRLLQDYYDKKLQSSGFDRNTSKLRMGAQTAGDLATVASFAVAPMSGSALAQMPAKQALKSAGTDLLTNTALNSAGMGASAYGQGASWQDSLKAAGTGAGMSALLIAAGYGKGMKKQPLNEVGAVGKNVLPEAPKTPQVGKTIYRGVASEDTMLRNRGRGTSFSFDKSVADKFASNDELGFARNKQGVVGQFELSPTAKVMKATDYPKIMNDTEALVAQAKKDGYSAIDMTGRVDPKLGYAPENEIRVLDHNAIKRVDTPVAQVGKTPELKNKYGQTDYPEDLQAQILNEVLGDTKNIGGGLMDADNAVMSGIAQKLAQHLNAPKALYKFTGAKRTYRTPLGDLAVGGDAKAALDNIIFGKDISTFNRNMDILANKFGGTFKEISDTLKSNAPDGADYERFTSELKQLIDKRPNYTRGNSEVAKNSPPKNVFTPKTPTSVKTAVANDVKPATPAPEPLIVGPKLTSNSQSTTKKVSTPKELPQSPVKPLATSSLNNTPKGQKERGFVTSVKTSDNATLKVKENVSGTYTPKANTKLMGEAKALLQDGAKIDFKNTVDLDKKVAATIQEAVNLQKSGDHASAAALYNNLSEHATELGRGVQAFSLLDNMSPEAISLSVAKRIKKFNETHKFKKIPEMNGEQSKMIADKMTEIDLLKPGREKNIALNELSNTLSDFIPSTIVDKAVTVWKAGLLTSLRTHERNFLGNLMNSIAEVAKDVPATGADMLMRLKTGNRTVTATAKGLREFGSKSTRQQIKDIVSKGYDPMNMVNKFDYKRITWGNNLVEKGLKKYTDIVFNTLGAEDKPFYNAALARSLYDQAGAVAINAGKRGNKVFIEKLVKAPTEEMMTTAIGDANVAVFKNRNMVSGAVSGLKRSMGKTELGKAIGEITMPFTGVPSSIAGQMIAYSPIGLIKGIAKSGAVLAGKVPELQRAAAQEIGRGVIGSGLVGLGAYLTAQGLMTGQPKDAKEAKQWELEGKQSNSIYLFGKWRSIGSVGPESLVLLAGSKIQSGKGNIGGTAASIGKDFTSQTFLQGVQGPLNAISDPARYGGSYAKSQAASVIPNILKDAAKAFDSTARDTNSVGDQLKASIPGLRNTLQPKRDALGNEIKQAPTGLGAFVDLFNSKTPISNPLVNELSRLYKEGQEATPAALTSKTSIGGVKVELTPSQLNNVEKNVGDTLRPGFETFIKTPQYKTLDDETKKGVLDNYRNDIVAVEKQKYAAENNIGPYTTSAEKTLSLTAKQKKIVDGTITIDDYLPKVTAVKTAGGSTADKSTAKKTTGTKTGGTAKKSKFATSGYKYYGYTSPSGYNKSLRDLVKNATISKKG